MAKFMRVFFNCSCVDLLFDSLFIYPHWYLKLRNYMNLHFVPADKLPVKDDTWCQTLGQFIGVHYLNLNPNKQFQKKPKQRRVEEMETPEVLKKEYVKIPGVN